MASILLSKIQLTILWNKLRRILKSFCLNEDIGAGDHFEPSRSFYTESFKLMFTEFLDNSGFNSVMGCELYVWVGSRGYVTSCLFQETKGSRKRPRARALVIKMADLP